MPYLFVFAQFRTENRFPLSGDMRQPEWRMSAPIACGLVVM